MKTKITVLISILIITIISSVALSFGGKPENSKLDITTASDAKGITFNFKVVPKNGMKKNLEGPWSLKLKKFDGLEFKKAKLGFEDLDKKFPGFHLTTSNPPSKPSGKLEYRLTSFVCTKDASKCFREVHKGTFDWKYLPKK